MRDIVYLPAALGDLRGIANYIADDNPSRATSFVEELRAVALKAAEHPESFQSRADLARGLRSARHGRYLVFFTVTAKRIEVVRVLHGARDLVRILNEAS